MPNILFIERPIELLFLQGAGDGGNLTTFTFSSQNLGVASADRRIVVCTRARRDFAGTVTSATIGGVAATIHINDSIGLGSTAIFSAIVPTGATGDIVITWSILQVACTISAYSIKGESSATPEFAISDLSSPLDITPTISGNTAVIAHGGTQSASASFTWSGSLGVVENLDHIAGVITQSTASLVTSGSGNIVATPTVVSSPALQVIGWK